MKINESKVEVQRAIRGIHSAFDSVRKEDEGKQYNVAFALGLAEPMISLTGSEVSSFIEVVGRVVNQFSASAKIALQLDIVEYSDVAQKIVEKSRANYEESRKLEGKFSKQVTTSPDQDTTEQQG